MTLTTPYSATFIVGDGITKTFSYLFEEVNPNFISVMVYNSLTGLISTPTYIIDTDQKQVIFGEDTPAPTADETVCIYRNTPNVQDVAFRTLHGYNAQTLENILSKIVAMIQEIKSNYFSTQVLQGDPWQLDLLNASDDGATVNIDYTAKKLVKGLYFRIVNGDLQVSKDGVNYKSIIKTDDIDNITIRKFNGKLSAFGTKNQNLATGAVKTVYDWVGTEAQYYEQDVGNQHPDWVCFVIDDDKEVDSLYITVDYNSPNERLMITSGGTGVGTKITQANYSNMYMRLILS